MLSIQLLLFLLFLIFVAVTAKHLKFILFKDTAPFFFSKKGVIKKSLENIEVVPEMKVYELGCGTAGFLKTVKKKHPDKGLRLVGVENFVLALFLLKIQNKVFGHRIKIINQDIFSMDISDADLVYCFLNVPAMKEVKQKLLPSCSPGTTIISYQFSLPGIKPKEVINYSKRDKIFIYKI